MSCPLLKGSRRDSGLPCICTDIQKNPKTKPPIYEEKKSTISIILYNVCELQYLKFLKTHCENATYFKKDVSITKV